VAADVALAAVQDGAVIKGLICRVGPEYVGKASGVRLLDLRDSDPKLHLGLWFFELGIFGELWVLCQALRIATNWLVLRWTGHLSGLAHGRETPVSSLPSLTSFRRSRHCPGAPSFS
jgi:hypothetical protein